MNWFTAVPEWIIQDLIVYALALVTIFFILKREKKPFSALLEMVCFVLLYAGIYENLAGVMGWYGFGRSLVMVFNVPLSVPLVEYLIVYAGIRLGQAMKLKTWMIPILVGGFGVLFDFSLDPLAVSQIHTTAEGIIGRWSWYPAAGEVSIFGIPYYNFTGWFILCGYATVFLLVGRRLRDKYPQKSYIGYLYPPLAMLAGLLVMVSPLSSIMLWLGVYSGKGGVTEYIMLGASLLALAAVLVYWRGRMKTKFTQKSDFVLVLAYVVCHLSNLIFALIGGHYEILALTAPIALIHIAILVFILYRGGFFDLKNKLKE
jgi:hypothetical protein